MNRMFLAVAMAMGLGGAAGPEKAGAASTNRPMEIQHAPVRNAVSGQSLAIRVRVVGSEPRSVTLMFAPSKDAAPTKIPMIRSSPEIYSGTISDWQLQQVGEVYYYIEARDASDSPAETAWYTVQIHAPGPARPPEPVPPAVVAPPARPTPAAQPPAPSRPVTRPVTRPATPPTVEAPRTRERSWVKPALVAGGVLLVGGAAYAIVESTNDDDDDDTPATSPYAGTYNGTATTCVQEPGGSSSCQSRSLTIIITDSGVVQSDNLRADTHLEVALSGTDFVLTADVDEGGFAGEIQYVGSVVDRRVVGTVQGSASSNSAVRVYSGSFSAVR